MLHRRKKANQTAKESATDNFRKAMVARVKKYLDQIKLIEGQRDFMSKRLDIVFAEK